MSNSSISDTMFPDSPGGMVALIYRYYDIFNKWLKLHNEPMSKAQLILNADLSGSIFDTRPLEENTLMVSWGASNPPDNSGHDGAAPRQLWHHLQSLLPPDLQTAGPLGQIMTAVLANQMGVPIPTIFDVWAAKQVPREDIMAAIEVALATLTNSAMRHPMASLTARPTAWHDVLAERQRQMARHTHDDDYIRNELMWAAIGFLAHSGNEAQRETAEQWWPWGHFYYHAKIRPKPHRQRCVQAAALLLAEIERVDRCDEAD